MAFGAVHLGIASIVPAAVAGWAAGAAWYGILCKQWDAALGWTPEQLAVSRAKSPLAPMLFSFFAELVMALILLVVLGQVTGNGFLHGVIDGAVLWLGFVATTTGVNYAFQRKSLALLAIDAGHWLLVLLIQGALIGGLR